MLDAFEHASARFRCPAAPLLEEERDSLTLTQIPDLKHPTSFHRACIGATLAADDDPRDSFKVEISHRLQQRFYGKKTNRNRSLLEVSNSASRRVIFNGHAAPDMSRSDSLTISAFRGSA